MLDMTSSKSTLSTFLSYPSISKFPSSLTQTFFWSLNDAIAAISSLLLISFHPALYVIFPNGIELMIRYTQQGCA